MVADKSVTEESVTGESERRRAHMSHKHLTIRGLRKEGTGNPFLSLLRTQFKVEYGPKKLAENLNLGGKTKYLYLYLGLLAIAFWQLIDMGYKLARTVAAQSVALAQPGLPVLLAVIAGQGLVLFIGISGLMSTLYYSDDLETLQAMPLKPHNIILAKVLCTYVAQLLFSSMIVVPFLLALGVELVRPGYWPGALLVTLAVPAVPLAVGLFGVVLIMRFTSRAKRKDFFRVVFGLVFLVLIMTFQSFNMNMMKHGPEQVMEALFRKDGLIQLMARNYPPLRWAAMGLTGDTLGIRMSYLTIFLGSSFGLLLGLAYISQIWFLGGISRDIRAESPARKLKKAGTFMAKERSPALSIMFQEHRVLTRTPGFLLVALTNLAVAPLLIAFGTFGGGAELTGLLSIMKASQLWDMVLLGAVGVHGILVGLNQVASTAITREGPMFWFSKSIPVPPREQVRGKLRYCMLFACLQLAVLLPVVWYIMRPDWPELLLIALLGLLVSWPVSQICLINDLYNPKMQWTQPQQAMKGNFQTLVAGLFTLLYLGIITFVVRTALKINISGVLLYALVALLLAGSGSLLSKALERVAAARYREIQV